jgi:hypothetical protein
MRRPEFEAWLATQTSRNSGNKLASPQTLVTDAQKVDRHLGDLDIAFRHNGLRDFLSILTYGVEAERAQKPNPTIIDYEIDAPVGSLEYFRKLKQNLSASKSSVNKYKQFCESEPEHSHFIPFCTTNILDTSDSILIDSLSTDPRERTLGIVRLRRGQPKFRNALVRRYGNSCMISGCKVMDIVEACHIYPYHRGEISNTENGLLLRSDLHTLFDLGLIAIRPSDVKVMTARALIGTEYAVFHHQELLDAQGKPIRPSRKFLEWHAESVFRG